MQSNDKRRRFGDSPADNHQGTTVLASVVS